MALRHHTLLTCFRLMTLAVPKTGQKLRGAQAFSLVESTRETENSRFECGGDFTDILTLFYLYLLYINNFDLSGLLLLLFIQYTSNLNTFVSSFCKVMKWKYCFTQSKGVRG